MPNEKIVDLIRLSDRELTQLLERLDNSQHSGGTGGKFVRKGIRWNLRQQRAVVTVIDEGSGKSSAVVIPRNLSTQGIGFLYGGYLYKNQRCVTTLRSREGEPRCVPGVVLRCSHIKGRIHEVGVRFDHPIAPSDFLLQDPSQQEEYLDSVDSSRLSGTAVIVSQDKELTTALLNILQETRVRATTTKDISRLRRSLHHKPDVIFLDASAVKQEWEQAMRSIRSEGYDGAILHLVPKEGKLPETRVILAGGSEVISSPPQKRDVLRSLAQHILPDGAFSPLANNTTAVPCDQAEAAAAIKQLAESVQELRKSITENDIISVIQTVEDIAAQAEQLGIEIIETLTDECIEQLRTNGIAGAQQSLNQLATKCAEAGDDPTPPNDTTTPQPAPSASQPAAR